MTLYECPKCKARERQTPVCRNCNTDLMIIGEDPAYEAGRQSRQEEIVTLARAEAELWDGGYEESLVCFANTIEGAK